MRRIVSVGYWTALVILIAASTAHADTTTLMVSPDDLGEEVESLSLSLFVDGVNVNISYNEAASYVVQAVIRHEHVTAPEMTTEQTGSSFFIEFTKGIGAVHAFRPVWDITIGSSAWPIDLVISGSDLGSDRGIDLGGVPLRNLELITSGSSIDAVDFSSPTAIPLENASFLLSGSILTISNIGNCDFSNIEFSGSANLLSLDFNGSYSEKEHHIQMSGSANAVEYHFPADVGIEIEVTGLSLVFGSIWSDEWEREWLPHLNARTTEYDTQSRRIEFKERQLASTIAIEVE